MHIVIGVDSSANSVAAARFVRDLFPPPGSHVTVLGTPSPGQTTPRPKMLRVLNKVKATLVDKDIKVEIDLLQGYKIEHLLQFTQQHPADMLILGENGLRPRFGVFADGAPQRVVETVRCPVLVMRTSYAYLRHILLAVDFTWSGRRAIRYLEQFHLPAQAKISVMHVQSPENEVDDGPSSAAMEPNSVRMQRNTPAFWGLLPAALQASATSPNDEHGILHYATEFLRATGINTPGDAATAITHYARRHRVDLVIAGSRTVGQMTSWITEDISRRLIHNTGCAVLISKESNENLAHAYHKDTAQKSDQL